MVPGARPFVGHLGQPHHQVFQFGFRSRAGEEARANRDDHRQQEAPQRTDTYRRRSVAAFHDRATRSLCNGLNGEGSKYSVTSWAFTSTPGSKTTGTPSTPNLADFARAGQYSRPAPTPSRRPSGLRRRWRISRQCRSLWRPGGRFPAVSPWRRDARFQTFAPLIGEQSRQLDRLALDHHRSGTDQQRLLSAFISEGNVEQIDFPLLDDQFHDVLPGGLLPVLVFFTLCSDLLVISQRRLSPK